MIFNINRDVSVQRDNVYAVWFYLASGSKSVLQKLNKITGLHKKNAIQLSDT